MVESLRIERIAGCSQVDFEALRQGKQLAREKIDDLVRALFAPLTPVLIPSREVEGSFSFTWVHAAVDRTAEDICDAFSSELSLNVAKDQKVLAGFLLAEIILIQGMTPEQLKSFTDGSETKDQMVILAQHISNLYDIEATNYKLSGLKGLFGFKDARREAEVTNLEAKIFTSIKSA